MFDGLQGFIKKNLPIKYIISYAELDYIKANTKKRLSNFADLKVFCVSHVGDITVLGQCLKKHVRDIQRWLIGFLRQKGLAVRNALIFQGKLFKPNSFLKYLSFKLIYSDLNKFNFNKNKYKRLKYTSVATRVQTIFSGYLCRSLYVLIQNRCIKNLRDKLKRQLSKKNSCLAVDQMISSVNTTLINSFERYTVSFAVVRQFFSLKNLLHKLFYKYLLRKYSSLSKIYSYIKTHFKNQDSFRTKNNYLLRIIGINFSKLADFYGAQNIRNKSLSHNIKVLNTKL